MDMPTAFRLNGKRYKVVEVEGMTSGTQRTRSILGDTDFDKRQIKISQANSKTKRKYSREEMNNAFAFEFVKVLLTEMDSPLANDSCFVTNFADLLQESIDNFKY